jgi:hypothetical protein
MSNATTMLRMMIPAQPERARNMLVFGSDIWVWNHQAI